MLNENVILGVVAFLIFFGMALAAMILGLPV